MKKRIYKYLVVAALILMCICATVLAACNKKDNYSIDKTVSSVAIFPAGKQLAVGETAQLNAIVAYSDNSTDSNVTWSSSATMIASVNESGVVTAKSAGTATVTATAGGKLATCVITVVTGQNGVMDDGEVIYFDCDDVLLTVGEETVLTVSIYPENATNSNFTWKVIGNDDIIEVRIVENGLKVKGLNAGAVILQVASVSCPSATDSVEVTVNDVAVDRISILGALELDVGETFELWVEISIFPDNAKAILTWSTSNATCVTVDANGQVKAVGVGSATITVTDESSDKFATCAVTVVQHVKSISLSETSLDMLSGASCTLTVSFNPSEPTNTNYTVSVDNDGIVNYEENGTSITITALAEGVVRLTVTSLDNEQAVAFCYITVSNPVVEPTLDCCEVTLTEIGSATVVTILLDGGEINDFTVTNSSIFTVEKQSNNAFTVTGIAFGTDTVDVSVTYNANKTVNLPLTVRVISSYFYLFGSLNGEMIWDTMESEDEARNENRLLEKVGEGIYQITRDFQAGDTFFIAPAELGDDWNYGVNSSFYVSNADDNTNGIINVEVGMQLTYAGNYTVTLDLTGSNSIWTITVNEIISSSINVTTANNHMVYFAKIPIWGGKND